MECPPLPSTAIDVSCYSSAQDRDADFARIQREISTLTRKILDLKIRQNSLIITARLPDELLARIFTWNLSMQRSDIKHGWLNVAAVCATWRRTALACPHLWSFIRLNGANEWLTEVMLPRSGAIPLHIWVDKGRTRDRFKRRSEEIQIEWKGEIQRWTGCRRALEEIYRVRELLLIHRPDDSKETFSDVLSSLTKPAPILEYLKVDSIFHGMHHLPDNLFANTAPRLRKLKLRNCTISPGLSMISGLTNLKLVHDDNPDISLTHVMKLLGLAINLQTLQLITICLPDHYAEPMPTNPYIVLSNLRRFVVADYTSNCFTLLSCIDYPASTYLDICPSDFYKIGKARALGNKLGSSISSVTDLEIKCNSKQVAVEVRGRSADKLSSNTVGFQVRFYKDWGWLNAFRTFLETLPILNVESLCIQGQFPPSFLLNVFGDKALLHTLHVQKYTRSWFEALLIGVSHQELITTVTTGEEKWVHVSRCVNGNGGLESESSADFEGIHPVSDTIDINFPPLYGSSSHLSIDYERLVQLSELSDEAKLAELKLPRASGPLHFRSLRSLKIDLCQDNSEEEAYFVDTAVLAAILHLRKTRGLPVHELSVENCRSLSPNAEQHVTVILNFVNSLNWDVKDGLVDCREAAFHRRGRYANNVFPLYPSSTS
ncbi:hypothetical protein C0989_001586 [Termitomyces sp. Mn162]|nr:hypothetical protein C0989_001586 [Termitomyces sp. Mn162]